MTKHTTYQVVQFSSDLKKTDEETKPLDSVGEGEGGKIWENGIETCNSMYEMSRQSRFDARYWMLGAGALG